MAKLKAEPQAEQETESGLAIRLQISSTAQTALCVHPAEPKAEPRAKPKAELERHDGCGRPVV